MQRKTIRSRWVRKCAVGALVWSGTAFPFPGDKPEDKAGFKGVEEDVDKVIPYGSAQIEHNSNVFDLSGRDEALAQNGDDTLADTVRRYVVGVEICLPLSNQKLRVIMEGRRLQFDHFSRLDHDEYLAAVGMDLHLSENLDGAIDYQQERRMANFADRDSTVLTLENERTATGSLSLVLDPQWRLEAGLRARELDSPQPDFPEFVLQENTVNAELQYLVEETLIAGVYAEYLTGQFEGTTNTGKFNQQTLALTADYSSSELANIEAQLGFTQRQDEDGGGKLTELTGEIAYHVELTGKTTMDLEAFRRVESYVRDASSLIETGVGAELAWKPTTKILVAIAYHMAQGRSEDTGREDDIQDATLRLSYQVLPWLAVRPYLGYEDRESNIDLDSFRTQFAGIELQLRF